MPEMKHCDVCDIDLQMRSYTRHLASQRHIRARRAGVANPELEALRAEYEARRDALRAEDAECEARQAELQAERAELQARVDEEREAQRVRRERDRLFKELRAAVDVLNDRVSDINDRIEAERDRVSDLNAEYEAERARVSCSYMKILGLLAGYTARDLKKAYKRAAVVAHPDKGGSNIQFRAVHDAYEHLKAW